MPPLILCSPYRFLQQADSLFAKVSMLLHLDTASQFKDSSSIGVQLNPVTASGGIAQIVTDSSVFGGGSLRTKNGRLASSQWYEDLYLPGDFTIECWVNPTTLNFSSDGGGWIATLGEGWGLGWPMWSLGQSGSQFVFNSCYADAANSTLVSTAFGKATVGKWHHIAITRQGAYWRTFVNGVLQTMLTAAGTPYRNTSKFFSMGGDTAGYATRFFDGYIDDFRVTKGAARYTTNFTPPTQPFSNN